jgi:hypothetical protein
VGVWDTLRGVTDVMHIRAELYNEAGEENGVLPRWTYRYPFDHRSQAMFGPVSTWMGDLLNDKYAGCC